ncbi:hypothetical protein E4U40_004957 [Claviceps sp. LM458 group G5]|nr:hypothetical protein E4U40_004957 [Claviceps sp. LM458 group G5]
MLPRASMTILPALTWQPLVPVAVGPRNKEKVRRSPIHRGRGCKDPRNTSRAPGVPYSVPQHAGERNLFQSKVNGRRHGKDTKEESITELMI